MVRMNPHMGSYLRLARTWLNWLLYHLCGTHYQNLSDVHLTFQSHLRSNVMVVMVPFESPYDFQLNLIVTFAPTWLLPEINYFKI